jgi:hypothetical protein
VTAWCEIPRPKNFLGQAELTDAHRVPRHVSLTAPEGNKEFDDLMRLPWHFVSGKHLFPGNRGKDA